MIVAVTGPTGDIGRALLRRLDADPLVTKVLGMARRPFDPGSLGLEKTEYTQGDVLDRDAVRALAAEADVLVHLAFIIVGGREETRAVNLEGSRNVFEAARGVAPARLHLFRRRLRLPRRQPAAADRGRAGARHRRALLLRPEGRAGGRRCARRSTARTPRPTCSARASSPAATRWRSCEAFPALLRKSPVGPVLPDPGTPFQLVHTEDVALALAAAVRGEGEPGVYNLAGAGTISVADLARALGWRSVPVPRAGVAVTAAVTGKLPLMPPQVSWLNALRVPVVMDTARAREQLGWKPQHDTKAVLADTARSARERGLL